MSVTRALAGFVGLGIIIVGFGAGAAQLRRRFWPGAVAPTTWLVDTTLGCAAIVVCGSVLGSLGLLHPAPLVATGVTAGGSALAIARTARRRGTEDTARERAVPTPRPTVWAALATAAVVAIRWSTEVLQTLSRGFSQPDELHYHLTHSALFAQSGDTWPIRFTSVGDGAAYHPANSELLHAIGLVVVGSDFVSIFLNLAFAALALCAGWVLGRRAGFPLCGTLIVATVLCTPVIANEAGSALNDTMAIAFLLAAAALLLEVRSGAEQNQRVQAFVIAIAGASTGVAAGTKLTVLVPAIALAVVASLSMERRWFAGATFVGTALLTGGYWFVRNLVHTGNPVPALSFGPLPGPDLEFQRSVEFPVIDYLFDVEIWREYFVPGLRSFFGPLWPILLITVVVLALMALAPGTRKRDVRWSVLSATGAAALLAYAVTPTSAAGTRGAPVLFEFNLRYALPGLLLCTLAGLAHPRLAERRTPMITLFVILFAGANVYSSDLRRTGAAVVVVAAAVGAALAFHAVGTRAGRAVLVATILAVASIGALVANDRYLENRWTAELPRWQAYEAAKESSGLRVGVTGFPQNYPFFGDDLSNHVITLGRPVDDLELAPYESCAAWWQRVETERLDVVVVLRQDALVASDLGAQIIAEPTRWLERTDAPSVLQSPNALIFDVRDASPACPQ